MAKYIKTKSKSENIDTKNPDFSNLVSFIQASLRKPRTKTTKPAQEGEILVEFLRALCKESTKSFRSEFAGLMGLKESGLNSVLYQRNITGRHLANILLQLANVSAEEFISEFFLFLIQKKKREETPDWLKLFMSLKNLNDEEKKYIAMMGCKFDQMLEQRKKIL